ncbi:MAG: peptidase M13, partial [Proteobacteria bacterium]|nr:peptidase M13 [Pseudomonadota bacterium]
MNYRLTVALAMASGLFACQQQADQQHDVNSGDANAAAAKAVVEATIAATIEPVSGLDFDGFDTAVRPQDDLFAAANGKWIAENELPPDRARWGTFDQLHDQSQDDVKALVEEVSAIKNAGHGSATQKIRDFYNAYMDAEKVNELGIDAIRTELDEIAAIATYDDLFRAFGSLGVYGVDSPIGGYIFSDLKDPDTTVVYLSESGITLPDRDYYLLDDEQFVKGRELYRTYVARLFELAGVEGGADKAETLLALEHQLAQAHWTKEDNRDPVKSYNPKTPEELQQMAPKINWDVTLKASQVLGRDRYIVSQPSYFEAASDIIAGTGISTWKDYLTFHTIDAFAPILSDDIFQAWFEFHRAGLQG